MADRGEDGFTLLEVVICVALVIAACVLALGVVPALTRAAQSGLLRDAATTIGRAALDRVRAATAYYPATGYAAGHAFALQPSATYVAAAHVHRRFCYASQTTTDVPMTVALAYDAASDSVTATVSYPRDPCDATVLDTVVLDAQLAPSALAPGTTITTAIDDPAQQ
jgi:type II secretory pathway pseudopilin PulG